MYIYLLLFYAIKDVRKNYVLRIVYFFPLLKLLNSDLYRCTVHSAVYSINTPRNAHIFI